MVTLRQKLTHCGGGSQKTAASLAKVQGLMSMAKQNRSHLAVAPQQGPEGHGIAQAHGIEPGASGGDWRMMKGKQGWA